MTVPGFCERCQRTVQATNERVATPSSKPAAGMRADDAEQDQSSAFGSKLGLTRLGADADRSGDETLVVDCGAPWGAWEKPSRALHP